MIAKIERAASQITIGCLDDNPTRRNESREFGGLRDWAKSARPNLVYRHWGMGARCRIHLRQECQAGPTISHRGCAEEGKPSGHCSEPERNSIYGHSPLQL